MDKTNTKLPQRKSIRRPGTDYSACGSYFLKVCLRDKAQLLWDMRSMNCAELPSRSILEQDSFKPVLSAYGQIAQEEIFRFSTIYQSVQVLDFCIMADHIHIIISLMPDSDGMPQANPSIPRIIQQFKRAFSLRAKSGLWQASYYDRILRNEGEVRTAIEYIRNNPGVWRDHLCE